MADCPPANALRAEQLQCPDSQSLVVANDVCIAVGASQFEVRGGEPTTRRQLPRTREMASELLPRCYPGA